MFVYLRATSPHSRIFSLQCVPFTFSSWLEVRGQIGGLISFIVLLDGPRHVGGADAGAALGLGSQTRSELLLFAPLAPFPHPVHGVVVMWACVHELDTSVLESSIESYVIVIRT